MKGLAWPLRKDDTHKSRSVNNFFVKLDPSHPSLSEQRSLQLTLNCFGAFLQGMAWQLGLPVSWEGSRSPVIRVEAGQ